MCIFHTLIFFKIEQMKKEEIDDLQRKINHFCQKSKQKLILNMDNKSASEKQVP